MESTGNMSGIDCTMNWMPGLNISTIGKRNVTRGGHADESKICEFLLEELGNRNINANPGMKEIQPTYDRAVVAF